MEKQIWFILEEGGYGAFTDTFEDLHGMVQLPGLPVQRLMADGYGFGGEGDWKHAALVRVLKVMSGNNGGGTSFMEDYTYHFDPSGARCLGSHMLEICPSISAEKPRCEIHPLGIGGKADPVRLVSNGSQGAAINASLVDLGNRFRFLVNEVESVEQIEMLSEMAGVECVFIDDATEMRAFKQDLRLGEIYYGTRGL